MHGPALNETRGTDKNRDADVIAQYVLQLSSALEAVRAGDKELRIGKGKADTSPSPLLDDK